MCFIVVTPGSWEQWQVSTLAPPSLPLPLFSKNRTVASLCLVFSWLVIFATFNETCREHICHQMPSTPLHSLCQSRIKASFPSISITDGPGLAKCYKKLQSVPWPLVGFLFFFFPLQVYFESEYQLTVPVCGSHRMISTEKPDGVGGLYLLFLESDIFLPAFPKRESPQTCGKMSDLFSLSTNGPKWCHILVCFIFGPWLICADFCLFSWRYSQQCFLPCREAMYALSPYFQVYPANQASCHLQNHSFWGSPTPRRKETPLNFPTLQPHQLPPGSQGSSALASSLVPANFILQELSSVFKS